MEHPTPPRGTANGNPRFRPPQNEEHFVEHVADPHYLSLPSTSMIFDYSNMGWYDLQAYGQGRFPSPALHEPTLGVSQASLQSSVSSMTNAHIEPLPSQDNSIWDNTVERIFDLRAFKPSTISCGEDSRSKMGDHWQGTESRSPLFHGYSRISSHSNTRSSHVQHPVNFRISKVCSDGHLQGALKDSPMAPSSLPDMLQNIKDNRIYRRGTRFVIVNDGLTSSDIRVPKGYKALDGGGLLAPGPIANNRSQKSSAALLSHLGGSPSFYCAQSHLLPQSANNGGPAQPSPPVSSRNTLGASTGQSLGPFPTFSKGPMIKSSHQRARLTHGQVNKLSKSKLAILAAEKLMTFHPFPRLPFELRCMIYALMIPDRQIIEIKNRKFIFGEEEMGDFMLSYDFPAVFYISGEARDWAQSKFNYKLAFGNNLNGQAIYYDPQRDSLLFGDIALCEKFFGISLNASNIQRRARAGEPKSITDKSKAIEGPLFLAINYS
ncbi:hypothetical protein BKA65DRAFT_534880 [Rhexocercosporidium sp. MPI-PUGE-AT-0058]|nr:hypothetical protein BKA65DRAFT_534880 [Rhexocercosporidium sp. MPI-PUGE-AT-0058]